MVKKNEVFQILMWRKFPNGVLHWGQEVNALLSHVEYSRGELFFLFLGAPDQRAVFYNHDDGDGPSS